MLITTAKIIEQLGDYSNPRCKLQRLVREGTYIPIIRGYYETEADLPCCCLASVIRSPSYISFSYALMHHGMIPDEVSVVTNATRSTHRTKSYDTPFGRLEYRDVPEKVFPYAVSLSKERGYDVWTADPEKALCDTLYTLPSCKNVSDIGTAVSDGLRVYEWALDRLDIGVLRQICPLYRCRNTELFLDYMRSRR